MEDTLRGRVSLFVSVGYLYVLILVLMEDTLRVRNEGTFVTEFKDVLILVLMEDTLREQDIRILCISWIGIYKTNNACSC